MIKSRKLMIKYLLKETRYTLDELNKLSNKTIEKWYKEEIQCNREK
jgi:hypothetical protein